MTYEEVKELEIPLGRAKDLTGMKFGKLTPLFRAKGKNSKTTYWACICECGNFGIIDASKLVNGTKSSCGCDIVHIGKRKDITGIQYKHLTAIYPTDEIRGESVIWYCKCDCGEETYATVTELRTGSRTQCKDHPKRKYLGKQFGELTITDFSHIDKHGFYYWIADCSCGNKNVIVKEALLINGKTKSCGHLKGNKKDISGQIFGHLMAICPVGRDEHRNILWKCQCDCGNIVDKPLNNLVFGTAVSCGHLGSSIGEDNIKNILNQNNIPFISGMVFETCRFPDTNFPARFDFFLSTEDSHLIEFDGPQHFNYNVNSWNTKENFLNTHNHDLFKNQWAWDNEITLKRIPYSYRDSLTLEDLLSDKFVITPLIHPWYYPEPNTSYPYFTLETIDNCISV